MSLRTAGGCFTLQTMLKIHVTLGQIEVTIESNQPYPDAAHDMANRALALIHTSVTEVKAAGWNPFDVEVVEDSDE